MRALIITSYLTIKWVYESFNDSTPKMSAIFTNSIPLLFISAILLLLSDAYLSTNLIDHIKYPIMAAILCFIFAKSTVIEDRTFLDIQEKFEKKTKNQKINILVLIIIFDIFVFLLLIGTMYLTQESFQAENF